ncbi:hypothetical protein JOQ06_020331 [Pogonophryne albipinna]|uniref:Uncharacterized protein n=1 Tax=Pogonophryne albipinna TaxID=1090488 RepID=A0AAD6BTG2_9TELE|nr:hypothetical protein JOQ06_020331 [Pogonophryne albipinna]
MGLLQLMQKKADDRRMGIWGLPVVILSQTDTDIERSIAIHGPYAPSNYQGYFLQRAKSLFMGMSVCHRALANNPQDADSVHNPKEIPSMNQTPWRGCDLDNSTHFLLANCYRGSEACERPVVNKPCKIH